MTKSESAGLSLGWAATFGSFAAPLAVALAGALVQAAISRFEARGFYSSLDLIFLFGEPISLLATWTFGLPFVLYLRRRNALNAAAVCAGGAVIGAVFVVALLWLVSRSPASTAQVFGQSIFGCIMGLVVASTFCLLARIPFRIRSS